MEEQKNTEIATGYKMTELGPLPQEWEVVRLGDLMKITSGGTPSRKIKEYYNGNNLWVKSGELEDNIILDTEEKITDDAIKNSSAKIFPKDTVLIAMYGATVGKTAILKKEATTNQAICAILPNFEIFVPEFIRYYFVVARVELLKQRYGGAQPNISQTIIKNTLVPKPPLPEQRKIAAILSTVQKAIETENKLIERTRELKKAMMHKLFTEGTRGEKQKMTEIGPIPESWEVMRLGDSNMLTSTQYGLSLKGSEEGKYPILRMNNLTNGYITPSDLQFVIIDETTFYKFRLDKGDILFNRTNSLELVGKASIFNLDSEFVFASYLIRLKTNPNLLNPYFLNFYINWEITQSRLKGLASRGVSQANISATRLKSFQIPKPSIFEQQAIADILSNIDQKIEHHTTKKQKLEELFRTLLHELMTAKIRVNEVELKEVIK
ncbi:MAG: Type-1 restriction enzyme MjaXIP specificity protein [Candidatus Methanofastidiosum methylothiophilum]|uniref:Type-1 restriction enzyme MjaXIP specificity protein n=1 Tax=Candidatus Methanofastidiosum methylothiophilum TaxID=1705564 RepID=A0A150ILN7_9EURY|nr:MAG: Type-1 restriction enzyme MjaXIP specificity protein [Candidatus Methanofastidiosum methylthiophilus]